MSPTPIDEAIGAAEIKLVFEDEFNLCPTAARLAPAPTANARQIGWPFDMGYIGEGSNKFKCLRTRQGCVEIATA